MSARVVRSDVEERSFKVLEIERALHPETESPPAVELKI